MDKYTAITFYRQKNTYNMLMRIQYNVLLINNNKYS